MRRKMFASMCLLVTVAVLFASALIFAVMYGGFLQDMKREVRRDATYIGEALEAAGMDYTPYLERLGSRSKGNSLGRITLISPSGQVLFDNYAESPLANHAERPEFASAVAYGAGEDMRRSDTLGKQTYYYAVLLHNGDVLRVASSTQSVLGSLWDCLPFILLIVALAILAAMALAKRQTRKIVAPINQLNLEHPLANEAYEELAPLLGRIEKQNRQIQTHMAELEQKQSEFVAITENMNEALLILDAQANILALNRSATQLFGLTALQAPVGKSILLFERGLDFQRALNAAMENSEAEAIFSRQGHTYQLLASPVSEGGQVKGAVLLVLDITEKEAAEQMRREFSANVSHELKTPLQSISGYAEIIKGGLVKAEDIPRFVDKIYQEAQRLIALVEDIIRLSRLDEGEIGLQKEAVSLLPLVQEVAARLEPEAAKRDIQIRICGTDHSVWGVRSILEEMLYNLCENGIKYNREHGWLEIEVAKEPDAIRLSVRDSGIGIPPQHQARVFERFYRVDKSHSKETGGTGLGLSIVKHGAMFHGAKVELLSEEGKGTTIQLCFPKPNR